MKNVLLLALTAVSLTAFAPRAEAGGLFSRIFGRDDRCDRRDRHSRWDRDDRWDRGDRFRRSYSSRSFHRDRYYAPVYSRSHRVYDPYYRAGWGGGWGGDCNGYRRPVLVRDCGYPVRYYSAPRVAVSFGF